MSLVSNEGTRHHLEGLIEVCRSNIQEAINAFEAATSLEPNNSAHRQAVEALEQGWQLLPATSVSAAVWLGKSYQVLGGERASRRCWQEACQLVKELMEFNPATAYYWQGRVLEELGDGLGAMEAYRNALTQHLLYPARKEVKGVWFFFS